MMFLAAWREKDRAAKISPTVYSSRLWIEYDVPGMSWSPWGREDGFFIGA
jgi:hypothetical protein